ncbi:hypothetical protein OUZ56_026215 [Daphnia magna]|uniref:Uncharacterized protein n=1 Tax=Daphnia magna TaxID=35525 RepID=A0ABQ9ZL54_9CRUS|nr:hypothetical protein OUZ56_026215 [Daphnia magna]
MNQPSQHYSKSPTTGLTFDLYKSSIHLGEFSSHTGTSHDPQSQADSLNLELKCRYMLSNFSINLCSILNKLALVVVRIEALFGLSITSTTISEMIPLLTHFVNFGTSLWSFVYWQCTKLANEIIVCCISLRRSRSGQ